MYNVYKRTVQRLCYAFVIRHHTVVSFVHIINNRYVGTVINVCVRTHLHRHTRDTNTSIINDIGSKKAGVYNEKVSNILKTVNTIKKIQYIYIDSN